MEVLNINLNQKSYVKNSYNNILKNNMAKKNLGKQLTAEQKQFCEIYVTSEFFCNGTESYLEVYNIDPIKDRQTASSNAYKLLSQAKILDYIDSLLDSNGLNDQFVDKQLLKLIQQDSEKNVKLWAIKEYNILKLRIEKAKQKALDNKEITKDVISNITII